MSFYVLKKSTCWKNLPWQLISTRIFLLQQKIFYASKYSKIQDMHKWQSVLLNSNEIKLEAVNTISKFIIQEYKQCNSKKYCINDKLKFFLVSHLFYFDTDKKVLINLLNKIKQYIIYLCLKPEWEAKTEFVLASNFSIFSKQVYQTKCMDYLYSNKYNSQIYKNYFYSRINEYKIIYKCICTDFFSDKLNSLSYVNYCFKVWLDNGFIQEPIQMNSSLLYSNSQLIYDLIIEIMLFGIQWFHFKNLEVCLYNKIYNFKIHYSFFCKFNKIISSYNNKSINPFIEIFNFFVFTSNINRLDKSFNTYNSLFIIIPKVLPCLRCNNITFFQGWYINVLKKIELFFLNQLKKIVSQKNKLGYWKNRNYIKIQLLFKLINDKLLNFYSNYIFELAFKELYDLTYKISAFIQQLKLKQYPRSNYNFLYIKNILYNQLLNCKQNIVYKSYLLTLI